MTVGFGAGQAARRRAVIERLDLHHYTSAAQVPVEMEKLLKWYNDNKGKIHTIVPRQAAAQGIQGGHGAIQYWSGWTS